MCTAPYLLKQERSLGSQRMPGKCFDREVLSHQLTGGINLAKLHFYVQHKSSLCIYEPELSPELIFLVDSANVKVSVYGSGKLTFEGGNIKDIKKARIFMQKLLSSSKA
jgi:TATA-box binding protein (TBP) (component of TFIID and TFIIIB)